MYGSEKVNQAVNYCHTPVELMIDGVNYISSFK